MSYQSPIEIMYNDISEEFENNLFRVIQECNITVDRKELIKALQYDRNQYEKGFEDGKKSVERSGVWIGGELGECSVCGHRGSASDIWNGCRNTCYCPNCGAKLE